VRRELSSSTRPSSQGLAHAKGPFTSKVLRRESAFVSTGTMEKVSSAVSPGGSFRTQLPLHREPGDCDPGWENAHRTPYQQPGAANCGLLRCVRREQTGGMDAVRYGAGVAVMRCLRAAMAPTRQVAQESKRQTWGGPRFGVARIGHTSLLRIARRTQPLRAAKHGAPHRVLRCERGEGGFSSALAHQGAVNPGCPLP